MKSIIVDTNAFLRFFLDDIPEQKGKVKQLFHKAKQKEVILIVPQIIIFEIDFILEKIYDFPKEDIIDKLQSLITTQYLLVESRNIFNKSLLLYEKENISFVDSFLLAKSVLEDAELFTFDQKLQKL